MKLAQFHYDLPDDRIAQEPVTPRDHSKLLIVSCGEGSIEHRRFYELDQSLRPTDLLVTNATRVFPARLRGQKISGGKAELLLLAPIDETRWKALVRGPLKSTELQFPDGVTVQMEERLPEGEWVVRFSRGDLRRYLDQHGEMPLPPYIKRPVVAPSDRERYQTVFAKSEGAVAAPTAGFHFTPELLARLDEKGIERLEVVLHVGWGTFRPVRTETIEEHSMLAESYEITPETAQRINQAKKDGRRIVAVGTTVVRTLETVADDKGSVVAGHGESRLFIYPGYHFKVVDALITNFHLPDSTPLLLANAFAAHKHPPSLWGRARVGGTPPSRPSPIEGEGDWDPFVLRAAYQAAIQEGYRFYSYGDAMLMQ